MPRLPWLADAARATGAPVVEMDGWRTRGSDAFNPGGVVEHHTAGARTGDVPSLNIVTHGRSDLPGPLYNFLIARNSYAIYVIGAGRANHAGSGGWKGMVGNSSMVGIGYENAGGANDPWPVGQLEVGERLTAEIVKRLNRNPDFICEHKEWTTRKVDRHSTNGSAWRERIRQRMSGVTPSPSPSPSPPPTNRPVLRLQTPNMKGPHVFDLQRALNDLGFNVGNPDSVFGPKTESGVKQFQSSRGLTPDGVVGPKTWAALDKEDDMAITAEERRWLWEGMMDSREAKILAQALLDAQKGDTAKVIKNLQDLRAKELKTIQNAIEGVEAGNLDVEDLAQALAEVLNAELADKVIKTLGEKLR